MAQQHQQSSGRRRGTMTPQNALELPDNLGARCSLLYVWDEEYTIRALEGYLQFMELKCNFEDWDSDQLAPSVVIDLVWQQHLLYNKQYYKACMDYCGQIIGYDPEANMFADKLQEQKVKTTKIALRALYGRNFDAEVWSFQLSSQKQNVTVMKRPASYQDDGDEGNGDKEDETREDREKSGRSSSTPHHQNNQLIARDDTISDSEAEVGELRMIGTNSGLSQQQPHQPPSTIPRDGILPKGQSHNNTGGANSKSAGGNNGESVTVRIKCFIDGKTQDTCIRVKRTTKMKKVEDCLARLMNLEGSESIRFLVDGEQVSPWETLESMKVVDPEQHWFTVMPKVSSYQ